jgi:hypothetical protein
MSFLPSVLVSTMVMLLASASAQLVRDTALSQAQWEQQQQAMSRAELLLMQSASDLLTTVNEQAGGEPDPAQEVLVEQIPVSPSAELSDLPLSIFRISAVGRMSQLSVRLQADYVIDACDTDDEDKEERTQKENTNKNKKDNEANGNQAITCTPRIRRIAWRRLDN